MYLSQADIDRELDAILAAENVPDLARERREKLEAWVRSIPVPPTIVATQPYPQVAPGVGMEAFDMRRMDSRGRPVRIFNDG
jgi:hypothetical protein